MKNGGRRRIALLFVWNVCPLWSFNVSNCWYYSGIRQRYVRCYCTHLAYCEWRNVRNGTKYGKQCTCHNLVWSFTNRNYRYPGMQMAVFQRRPWLVKMSVSPMCFKCDGSGIGGGGGYSSECMYVCMLIYCWKILNRFKNRYLSCIWTKTIH